MSLSTVPTDGQIVLLRTVAQAKPLVEALHNLDLQATVLPTLRLEPVSMTSAAVAQGLASIQTAQSLIITSPNVIEHMPASWRLALQKTAASIITMGASTSASLEIAGIKPTMTAEPGMTSEILLETPCFAPQQVAGKPIVILTAKNGRTVLADTLKARGANVESFACYESLPPHKDFQVPIATWQTVSGPVLFVACSVKALQYLVDVVPREALPWLNAQPCLVVSTRMQDAATQLGFHQILMSGSADVAALIDAICRWKKMA